MIGTAFKQAEWDLNEIEVKDCWNTVNLLATQSVNFWRFPFLRFKIDRIGKSEKV